MAKILAVCRLWTTRIDVWDYGIMRWMFTEEWLLPAMTDFA